MLDIKFVRQNPDAVKENIKKKFQDEKLPLVDEVIDFDAKFRAAKTRCDELRAQRNKKSKEIGGLMAKGQKDEAEKVKAEVKAMADEMEKLEADEKTFAEEVKQPHDGHSEHHRPVRPDRQGRLRERRARALRRAGRSGL